VAIDASCLSQVRGKYHQREFWGEGSAAFLIPGWLLVSYHRRWMNFGQSVGPVNRIFFEPNLEVKRLFPCCA
jgi:hypothetical protein